ncbi:MAG: glycerate kinase [Ignavibacteriales bacterium]|nr:glycerate kinase [Ignavibacteriales bacterium]
MNILIAPNSFKECANSVEISEIICQNFHKNTSHKILQKPISDGGDGFLNVIQSFSNVKKIVYNLYDKNNNTVKDFSVLYDEKDKTVFIESAELFGLKVMPLKKRKPLKLNTEILGEIILNLAKDVNAKKYEIEIVWIGIGGTSTIDFGIGALSKLGLSFFDILENPIEPNPLHFININKIENKIIKLPFQVKCIVDVDTDLIDNPGAIEIYGKQKGASDAELKIIKSGIKNILKIISDDKKNIFPQKLNGAGGGLAAGLNIFLDAQIIKAKDFIETKILKDLKLYNIDAVITGEGSFDNQSFEGKGSGIILNLFSKRNIPIFLINGSTNLSLDIILPKNVHIINLTDFYSSNELSIKNYHDGLSKTVQIVLNYLNK